MTHVRKTQSSRENLNQQSCLYLSLRQPSAPTEPLLDRWAVVVGLKQGPWEGQFNASLPREAPSWLVLPHHPRAQRGHSLAHTALVVMKEASSWSILLVGKFLSTCDLFILYTLFQVNTSHVLAVSLFFLIMSLVLVYLLFWGVSFLRLGTTSFVCLLLNILFLKCWNTKKDHF